MFPKLLVSLHLGPDDSALLAHVGALAEPLGVEHIELFHVAPPGLADARGEELERIAQELIVDVPVVRHVEEGSFGPLVLRELVNSDTDLLAVGRGKGQAALAATPGVILRNAPCSVLVVPRSASVDLSRIVVPMDFSDRSLLGLDVATPIARSVEGSLLALHVFELPLGWHTTGMEPEDFEADLRLVAAQRWAQARSTLDLHGIRVEFRDEMDPRVHLGAAGLRKWLVQVVDDEEPGLVVIGSRGLGGAATLLLGSVSSHLVDRCTRPVLVVKHKGETLSVLQALDLA